MDHRRYEARIWGIAFFMSLGEAIKLLCAEMLCYAAYLTIEEVHSSTAWIVLLLLITAPFAAECMIEQGRKSPRRDDVLPVLSARFKYDRAVMIARLVIMLAACGMLVRDHCAVLERSYGTAPMIPAICAASGPVWALVRGLIYGIGIRREMSKGGF